jgi:hypothetical protein
VLSIARATARHARQPRHEHRAYIFFRQCWADRARMVNDHRTLVVREGFCVYALVTKMSKPGVEPVNKLVSIHEAVDHRATCRHQARNVLVDFEWRTVDSDTNEIVDA